MVNRESQSKTPPRSPESEHIHCILLIRIAFCHVSENLPLRYLFLRHYEYWFLFSMLILHVTSSRLCLYLLNIYHFTYTFSHAHTEAHTHKYTCRHRSLVERRGRKALLETLHTQQKNIRKKPIFTNLKKRFEHIELPGKLLDYFLPSNKSNINHIRYKQTQKFSIQVCAGSLKAQFAKRGTEWTIHHMFCTCSDTHASLVPAHRAHQSTQSPRRNTQSPGSPRSHARPLWARWRFWKIFWEWFVYIYWKNVLYFLPDNFLGTDIVPAKLAVQILILFVVIARKRWVENSYFVSKDPHQI